MEFLEQFINLRQNSTTNPQNIAQFENLLSSPNLSVGILKPGNVYSTIFQLYVDHQLFNEALHTLNGMKTTIPNFMNYLNSQQVSRLCLTLKISPSLYLSQETQDGEENPEDIKEIISNHRK